MCIFPEKIACCNAIALFKTEEEGYLPVGFYEHKSNVFVELQKLSLFSSITKPHLPFSKGVVTTTTPSSSQKYYVLENDYQQIVFTNKGGAVTEINLPFESEKNKVSVVKEIAFDRDIEENSPQNARFPSVPYTTFDSKEHAEGSLGGYYPLLRRNLKNQGKGTIIPPEYYAFNIVSDYPEVSEMTYEVKEFTFR